MATKKTTRKYGPAASKAVEREMDAMKHGTLRSGSGEKVTNPKQAIAIGLSEARKAGGKVPPNPNDAPAKKTAKKAPAKKTAKKAAAKKPAKKAGERRPYFAYFAAFTFLTLRTPLLLHENKSVRKVREVEDAKFAEFKLCRGYFLSPLDAGAGAAAAGALAAGVAAGVASLFALESPPPEPAAPGLADA